MDPAIADVFATELYALVIRSVGIISPDDIIEAISLRLQVSHAEGEKAAFAAALAAVRVA